VIRTCEAKASWAVELSKSLTDNPGTPAVPGAPSNVVYFCLYLEKGGHICHCPWEQSWASGSTEQLRLETGV
jgi:hypothetical protein